MPGILNYVGFQVGWFACVLGAGHRHYFLGPAVAAALLAAHVYFRPDRKNELKRLAAVAGFGLLLEFIGLSFRFYGYAGARPGEALPLWIVALWVLLAATLNSSLSWLARRPALAAAIGVVAGPLSFRAGAGLGAGYYSASPLRASVILGVLWAAALPGAFVVSNHFSRRSQ